MNYGISQKPFAHAVVAKTQFCIVRGIRNANHFALLSQLS